MRKLMTLSIMLLGNMKKLFLLFLILFSMGVQGKEKPLEFRVKIMPALGNKFYVIQYRKKSTLFRRVWYDWPVSNPQISMEEAARVIEYIKYDDSVRVAQQNVTYINF